jgi:DNA replication protein DnaC
MVKNRALKRDARAIKASTGITYPRARDLLTDPVDQDTLVPSLSLGYGPDGEDITYRPGKGTFLVIEGPSGFGKSLLMTRLAAEAVDVASVYVIDAAKQGTDYQGLSGELSALETTAAGALALVKRLGEPRHTASLLIIDEVAYTNDIPGFSDALRALSDSGMPIIIGGQAPHQFLSPSLRTRAQLIILGDRHKAAYKTSAGNGQVILPPGGKAPEPDYSFAFGADAVGSPATFTPARDRNLLVTGPPGAGKTWFLRALAADATKSIDVYVGTAGIYPKDLVWPSSAAGTAMSLATTADMLDELMLEAEIRSRQHYREDAAENESRPVLIVLDEFSSLIRNDPYATAAECPQEDRAARTRIAVAVGKIARAGRAAGVSLVLSSQTSDILQLIPGAGDLKVSLSQLVLGDLNYGSQGLTAGLRDPALQGLRPQVRQGIYAPLSGAGGLVDIALS